MKKRNTDQMFDIVIAIVLIAISCIILYPLYFTIIASVSEPYDVVSGNVTILPKGFTLESYQNVFANSDIWIGYRNSIIYTLFGTIYNLVLTIPAAFALSKKNLWNKGLLTAYFVITMYFSGGLLPTYLQVKNLGLLNKPYTLIILGGVSVYNLLVTRTYFLSSIPETLYEAAELDGCSKLGQFFRIAIPLAKPIIAVITLYYAVSRWNNFFDSLIYVSKSDYFSLQMVLRNILLESQNALSAISSNIMSTEEMNYLMRRAYLAESMKYAVIFVASLPMLIIYPFVQKYFVKGVMVGSVKG